MRPTLAFLLLFGFSCTKAATPEPSHRHGNATGEPRAASSEVASPAQPPEPTAGVPATEGADAAGAADAADAADQNRLENLARTRDLYLQFLERAEGRDEFSEAVLRARERLDDVDQEMEFLQQGIAERRLRELGQQQ